MRCHYWPPMDMVESHGATKQKALRLHLASFQSRIPVTHGFNQTTTVSRPKTLPAWSRWAAAYSCCISSSAPRRP